jgi:hypothetical protein
VTAVAASVASPLSVAAAPEDAAAAAAAVVLDMYPAAAVISVVPFAAVG